MLLRRLPYSFQQVRFMTARRPKYEHAAHREQNVGSRMIALGERQWPAITLSPDDLIYSIQQRVFGYDRGGEGVVLPDMKLKLGKKPVPVRTGRKLLKKAEAVSRLADWYPLDVLGKYRFKEMRNMRNNPEAEIKKYLGVHAVKDYGLEDFGPFLQFSAEQERARRRGRANMVLQQVKEDPEETALTTTEMERRRLDHLQALRKRGKAAPKKGQGKRSSGGKKK